MVNENDVMFSVEVLTYNQKDYIAQTLQSIIDQEHNYKYEILVSDDCSTDGTQEIIKEFHKKYPDVIKPVYNEKNLGAMQNYYATIMRAKGKYLMGCAGDDYWLPGKVEKQIEFMENNKSFAVCYGKAKLYNNNTKKIKEEIGKNYLDFKDLLTIGDECPSVTMCFRRDFFLKYLNEIKPQDRDWMMEDYPFLIYTAFNSNLFFMNKSFAVYRVIENSISHQTNIEKQLKYEKSVNTVKSFFAEMYNVQIPEFDIVKLRKKMIREKSVLYKVLFVIKRLFKAIIPYGIIKLLKRYN